MESIPGPVVPLKLGDFEPKKSQRNRRYKVSATQEPESMVGALKPATLATTTNKSHKRFIRGPPL